MSNEWELPRLRASFILQDDSKTPADADSPAQEFFDIKFYPYNPAGASPIFGAVSKKHAVICRLPPASDKDPVNCEILLIIRDGDEDGSNHACCWSRDPETGHPWLLVAGDDARIKVYDVKEGKLIRTLVGHGGGINDLATSPMNPLIIASAADDTTIRIWSLASAHAQQPCVCLLGGEGHAWDLLSVNFHDSGRYVLSSGHDQVINLWTIPEISNEHVEVPTVLHYPHFSTSEVHNNLVDCVVFYGDLILSRACHEDSIVLWRIEGFSSDDPPPTAAQAPTTHDPTKKTRSAFAPTLSPAQPTHFTRLMTFHTAECKTQFFLRFRMFHAPGRHPVLAFCNAKAKTMFWDLARFTAYSEFIEGLKARQRSKTAAALPPVEKPAWLPAKKAPAKKPDTATTTLRHAAAVAETASPSPDPENLTSLGGFTQKTLNEWSEMYDATNSHSPIKPHKTGSVDGGLFVGRQVGWSPEGDYCIVVGAGNRVLIFQRWGKEQKASTPGV
ncbi:WD40-repeat-containing domain protein [Lasiosphaeria ovina]|uniref:WD40-repeat-containing domain protein n=1 Tax=Lasiosphaeria ovina TaxID=92902 RepID=A0AAE0N4B0_9PEZI|nr:WD40-repeat-containing domain protein [Lasiosphaeria ovina]